MENQKDSASQPEASPSEKIVFPNQSPSLKTYEELETIAKINQIGNSLYYIAMGFFLLGGFILSAQIFSDSYLRHVQNYVMGLLPPVILLTGIAWVVAGRSIRYAGSGGSKILILAIVMTGVSLLTLFIINAALFLFVFGGRGIQIIFFYIPAAFLVAVMVIYSLLYRWINKDEVRFIYSRYTPCETFNIGKLKRILFNAFRRWGHTAQALQALNDYRQKLRRGAPRKTKKKMIVLSAVSIIFGFLLLGFAILYFALRIQEYSQDFPKTDILLSLVHLLVAGVIGAGFVISGFGLMKRKGWAQKTIAVCVVVFLAVEIYSRYIISHPLMSILQTLTFHQGLSTVMSWVLQMGFTMFFVIAFSFLLGGLLTEDVRQLCSKREKKTLTKKIAGEESTDFSKGFNKAVTDAGIIFIIVGLMSLTVGGWALMSQPGRSAMGYDATYAGQIGMLHPQSHFSTGVWSYPASAALFMKRLYPVPMLIDPKVSLAPFVVFALLGLNGVGLFLLAGGIGLKLRRWWSRPLAISSLVVFVIVLVGLAIPFAFNYINGPDIQNVPLYAPVIFMFFYIFLAIRIFASNFFKKGLDGADDGFHEVNSAAITSPPFTALDYTRIVKSTGVFLGVCGLFAMLASGFEVFNKTVAFSETAVPAGYGLHIVLMALMGAFLAMGGFGVALFNNWGRAVLLAGLGLTGLIAGIVVMESIWIYPWEGGQLHPSLPGYSAIAPVFLFIIQVVMLVSLFILLSCRRTVRLFEVG